MKVDEQLRADLEGMLKGFGHALQGMTDLQGDERSYRLKSLSNDLDQKQDRLQRGLVFTIAIVGQIKAGKSTLADVLFFGGRDVLPSGPTPTTSVLTQIDFDSSQKETATLHYYTAGEWSRIESQAAQFGSRKSGRKGEEDPAAEACAEMVEHFRAAGSELRSLLGTQIRIPLADLAQHAGPHQKASVLIHHIELSSSENWPAGFRVFDTPGLNDVVPSREKITHDSLHSADCVLFLSRADRFLEEADIETLQRLEDLGIQHVEVLASMFDQAEGQPSHLLGEFQRRLDKKLNLQGEILPVSALRAKLHGKAERGEALSEEERWYLERLFAGKDLLAESHIEPLRQHLLALVLKKRDKLGEDLMRQCRALGRSIVAAAEEMVNRCELKIQSLQGDQAELAEEVAKFDETKQALRLQILGPQAEQCLALFQSAISDFRAQLRASLKDTIEHCTALPDEWGNKKAHFRVFDQGRSSLEGYLSTRDTGLRLDGDLTHKNLKERFQGAIAGKALGAPRIVASIQGRLADELAQILSEWFAESAKNAYGPRRVEQINEPRYKLISEVIGGVIHYVDRAERELLLREWRSLQRDWDEAGQVNTREFMSRINEYFAAVLEPAFQEERRRASLPREEKEKEILRLRRDAEELGEILEMMQSWR